MNARQKYEHRVRTLESFGHRGSATDSEKRAADYLTGELQEAGLEVTLEAFPGSRSLGGRLLLHVVVAVVGVCGLWYSPTVTVVFGLIALVSLWAEQTTRVVGLSIPLVRAPSQNVTARIPSMATPRGRIILCGHYDTQRTGWIWAVSRFLTPFSAQLPTLLKPPLISLQLTLVGQILVGFFAVGRAAVPFVTLAGGLLLAIYAIYMLLLGNWAFGTFVPGAADNASGAAAVVTLAEAWRQNLNEDIEVVILLSGCEETGLLGAAAWLNRHRAEVAELPTVFLNLDGLGFGPPRFLGWEIPIVGWPAPYPRSLLNTAARVASEQSLACAGPHALPGPTDGLAFLARGVPGITVVGFREGYILPNYHEMQDTSDSMDFDAAWAGVEFARALMGQLLDSPNE